MEFSSSNPYKTPIYGCSEASPQHYKPTYVSHFSDCVLWVIRLSLPAPEPFVVLYHRVSSYTASLQCLSSGAQPRSGFVDKNKPIRKSADSCHMSRSSFDLTAFLSFPEWQERASDAYNTVYYNNIYFPLWWLFKSGLNLIFSKILNSYIKEPADGNSQVRETTDRGISY